MIPESGNVDLKTIIKENGDVKIKDTIEEGIDDVRQRVGEDLKNLDEYEENDRNSAESDALLGNANKKIQVHDTKKARSLFLSRQPMENGEHFGTVPNSKFTPKDVLPKVNNEEIKFVALNEGERMKLNDGAQKNGVLYKVNNDAVNNKDIFNITKLAKICNDDKTKNEDLKTVKIASDASNFAKNMALGVKKDSKDSFVDSKLGLGGADDGGFVNRSEGTRGNPLVRQDTNVAGCVACSGGRLVKCAKITMSPVLCWERKTSRPSRCGTISLLLMLFGSLITLCFLCFGDVFNDFIRKKMILKEGNMAFETWKDPPVHPLFKVYLFNYTNAQEVMSGQEKKFRVQEVGPYVYRQTMTKVHVEFFPNGSLSFQENYAYQFLPQLSNGNQYDKVFVPNIPLLSALTMSENLWPMVSTGLRWITSTLHTPLLLELPVHRFLWGYEDKLVSAAKPIMNFMNIDSMDEFGLLKLRNGTSKDKILLHTGEKDINKMGIIERYNGESKLQHWGTEECNRVDGSDGSMFPASMLDRKQTLYIYKKEMCRRFPLVYEKEVELQDGITALRYSTPDDVFDTPATNSANQCYCHMDSGVCPPQGTFNSSPCVFGSPVFPSFPHFYLGDPALVEDIDGLEPSAERHALFLDLHPVLGIPLQAVSRMQINIRLTKDPKMKQLKNLKEGLMMPVVWLETSVTELPQEIRALVYHATFSTNLLRLALVWACGIAVIVSGILLLMAFHYRKWKPVKLPS